MKNLFFAGVLLILCTMQLNAQESSVKILLNEEERFRFESIQLIFVNPSHHVMIGDSVGMNDTANANTMENTFLGFKAGAVNRDSWNTFLGARAGENHTTGYDNVFVGGWAGRYDSAGIFNTYVGANAGIYNKTGNRNTFIGRNTGVYSDSSSSNTFIGYNAGYYHSGGLYNVFVGRNAGAFSGRFSPVDNNTYLGGFAGQNNIYGQGNVFIGYQAGINDTSSSKLYISNTDTVPPLIYGEFDTQLLRFNAKRIEIRGSLENTIIGDSSGVWTTGDKNTFVGYRAGYSNTNGNGNTFIGRVAGHSNLDGSGNVFIGNFSGHANTSGGNNVILGISAGRVNTEGSLNVIIGTTSGFYNTTGGENVFLGTSAGAANQTGSYNTYLGRGTGWNNTEGNHNVFIGYRAGTNETGSDRLYISNSDTIAPLIYGEFDNELLRIHGTLDIKGIYQFPIVDGTSGQCMQTDGSGTLGWAKPGGDFSNGGEAGGADRSLGNTDDFALSFKTNDMTRLHLNNNGNIGIGTTTPSAKLDIYNTTGYNQLRMQTSYTPTGSSDNNGHTGDIAWDDDYVYIKTSTVWKRAALTTW
ncbi:MAG: hypothetical protein R6W71_04495 [Bacteroidales bacterium]